MSFGAAVFLFVVIMSALLIGCPLIINKNNREIEEQVERTKILAVTQQHTGRLNGYFYTETTFMLYYRDGRHKAVTVRNGSSEYNLYMGKLEG